MSRPYTAAESRRIIAARKAGVEFKQLAVQLNRSIGSLHDHCQRVARHERWHARRMGEGEAA